MWVTGETSGLQAQAPAPGQPSPRPERQWAGGLVPWPCSMVGAASPWPTSCISSPTSAAACMSTPPSGNARRPGSRASSCSRARCCSWPFFLSTPRKVAPMTSLGRSWSQSGCNRPDRPKPCRVLECRHGGVQDHGCCPGLDHPQAHCVLLKCPLGWSPGLWVWHVPRGAAIPTSVWSITSVRVCPGLDDNTLRPGP